MVSLGSFKVGAILLCGLFFYDIFWVFGTDKLMTGESVMVTVAKGLEAPIKLLFPRLATTATTTVGTSSIIDIAETVTNEVVKPLILNFNGEKLEFSMLGLGDIVIPGFFLALLLRFDAENAKTNPKNGKHGKFKKTYFKINLFAYFLGLLFTITMMTYFEAAQPALLYLVPACLGTALMTAFIRNELALLFNYDENLDEESKEEEKKENDKNK